MELALLILVVVVLGGGYMLYNANRENKRLKAEREEAKTAVRDVVPNLDEDLKKAQEFAAEQDCIAETAEKERLEALELARNKAAQRDTANKLAQRKRRNIDLI